MNEKNVYVHTAFDERRNSDDKMKYDIIKKNNITLSNVQTSLNKRSTFNYQNIKKGLIS